MERSEGSNADWKKTSKLRITGLSEGNPPWIPLTKGQ